MSIFLDLSGVSGTAFFNLLTVSGNDGGLGLTDVPGDATVFRITYTETAGQPGTADRLNQLVNNNFPSPITTTQDIVVTALNGGNDPHGSGDVTGNGVTYLDTTGPAPVIRVVYDVSQCCGSGLALFDVAGTHITTPNPVILYHELSHAFRKATGTQAANDEVPAETDENVLRTQLGLCLRDVNNHNGDCAGGADCGGSDGGADGGPPAGGCAAGNGGGGCFIVSAATGSAASLEVFRLRQLRERVRIVSRLGGQLIDRIYAEYAVFSPSLATEVSEHLALRQVVLTLIVQPLLTFYSLAGALAFDYGRPERVRQAAHEAEQACRALQASSLGPQLAAVRTGQAWPSDAPALLLEFGTRIREAAQLPFAAWAILDPLSRLAVLSADPTEQAMQWLASAPIDKLHPPSEAQALASELAVLSSFFKHDAGARLHFGRRLGAAWPHAAVVLERYGLIEARGDLP